MVIVMDADEEATGDNTENLEEEVTAEEEDQEEPINDEVVVEIIHEEEVKEEDDDCDGLVSEIVSLIEFLDQITEYRRTQQKECFNLVRRLKILVPFLEEIRGFESPRCRHFVKRLRKVILVAKKLLETCNNGSKIFLALDSESMMTRFHSIYEKLNRVLVKAPFDEMIISDDVKEEIDSLCKQLKKAKRRTDTQDIELAVDMMVVFSKTDPRNSDSAIIERLAKKLELQTIDDLKTETIAIKSLIQDKGGLCIETKQHIIELLNKFKKLQGLEATDILYQPVINKAFTKSKSLILPHEFLCPITLEIMQDPVIIATGQTYEKDSIQKWFDKGHKTCPKTRQELEHLSLAPNFALKNLIMQWCEKNNFKLPEKETSPHSENEQKDEVSLLVEALSSSHLEEQRTSVKQMRLLARENPENRVLIANAGAIPLLVQLLSYPDSGIQENAVTTLLNLSIDEVNKKLISNEGAIPNIIEILQNGNREARENSAAALFSLSMLDENKVTIGLSDGIPPLVDLLQHGTLRGKKDALTALFNLSLNSANKGRAIDAGIVQPLLNLLKDRNLGMIDEALSILLLLASHPEGRQAIGQLSFIESLVEFIRQGTPKNKECATSVLLELGSNNSSFILAALQFGVYEYLVEITTSGTNRAQRKANALIQLISKSEQI
ncbi:hypothetical protein CARUB_v10028542mg [Capsella rubella]|uniref:RING-type E3 ubiquitin transferase n=1 Tax=Capsella rubella TaxID=81985 RepID=R0GVH5_9BRAS|nr:U-box domain-containing protein 15 [Capsella rubella]EOA15163.1 hypothetical protein CARUB_v10028542mg [Capsella rubella]